MMPAILLSPVVARSSACVILIMSSSHIIRHFCWHVSAEV
jgi:hypothetical protein